jgi:hydrogenase-4 component F
MIWALILIPAAGGASAFLPLPARLRRMLLGSAASLHFLLALAAWRAPAAALSAAGGWLALDAAGLLFLTICSALFLAAALYAIGYLSADTQAPIRDYLEGFQFANRSEGVFIGCLLLFLATMSAVAMARHLGLLWVAVEATTLTSAPLIYYHRHHRSLSAAWKYLLICSVGIALALLGNFFLAVATTAGKGQPITLLMPVLIHHASALSPTWLKAAFLLMLVGYGTKMGLAPMHTWLPDAHSEAPSLVSALLSGALLNCAFLALLRMQAVLASAGMGAFGRNLLVMFGLLSMGWAALLLIAQSDYKRMLAYSSVEHMGVLSLGVGLGGVAAAGAMLHAVNHSLVKAALFLVAGNILAAYRTKDVPSTRGLRQLLPLSGLLWMAGILAVAGSPPFGLFTSELMILRGALAGQHWAVAAGYLAALGIAFGAMLWTALRMVYGGAPTTPAWAGHKRDTFLSVASPVVLIAAVLVLGLWVPDPLRRLIHRAAALWGGNL